jgi:gliding motility-associated-like protein
LQDLNIGVNSREWRKNGLSVSVGQNFTDSVINTGAGITSVTYSLTTQNSIGCDSTTTHVVYIRPEGALSFSTSNICLGDTAVFSASISPGYSLTSISWSLGDNNTSIGAQIEHVYLAAGTYNVSVSGIDQYGCEHNYSNSITVFALPIADFSLSTSCNSDTICLSTSYSFSDLSQPIQIGSVINSWKWDFDSNGTIESTNQNPNFSFNTTGIQQVTLVVESNFGCRDTVIKSYYVLEPLVAEVYLSEDSVCGPYVISDSVYTIGHIENYEWQLYRFSSSGSKIIEFVSTVSNPVLPTAYSPPGGNYTWYWSLEVSNCCDTIVAIDSVQIGSIPIPNFQITPDTGCSPLLVDFQLDGLIQGSPDYILLDFGDGITDSLTPTPLLINGVWQYIWGQMNHVYQYTGTSDTVYNATVFISNGCGDSSMTIPVFVQANTVQSFFNSNTGSGCSPLTVNFNNFSFSATNFTWCFDYDSISGICNGAVSNAPNPSHTFYTPGTYVVSLISDNGCSYDTAYQIITVSSGISAQINPVSDHCNGSPISLSVQILNSPTISSYYWDFGDGQVSTLSNPNHTYSAPGNYTISLALQTISGCVDTFYTSSTVIAKPTAEFGYYNLCFNSQPIQFFDSTVANGTMISGTLWDFGDGNSSTLINPVHSYSAPGTYIVELIKFNAFGCSDTIQHQVIIYPEPQLAFQPILISSDTCGLPQTYEFVNLSTNSFGYYWDFDFSNPGTSTSTLNQPTFSFTQAGTYTLALVGSNAFGCSDTIYQTLEIRPPVTSFFTINPETACEGIVFSFQDISQSDSVNDPIVNWIWDFGDGNSIFGSPAVQHTYQLPGVYIVQLSVETASGCTDNTYTSIAQVLEKPTASIGIGNQAFHQITFENNSLFIAGNPIFIWDFGDGYASSDFEPSHVYQSSGEYWVQFVIENENGCKDSTLIRVFIDDSFTIFIPNSFTPNEDGKNEIFYVQGMGIDEIQIEIFNRWGQRVFYSNDLALGWDGLIDGKEANQDTYVVRVSAKNYLFNKIEKKTSLLHLIR